MEQSAAAALLAAEEQYKAVFEKHLAAGVRVLFPGTCHIDPRAWRSRRGPPSCPAPSCGARRVIGAGMRHRARTACWKTQWWARTAP